MLFGKNKNGTWGFGVFEERFESYKVIDDTAHMDLINRANTEGKLIEADDEGNPILVSPPPPTEEEKRQQEIAECEAYLQQTDWYAIRYADTGKEIPEEIKIKREECREKLSSLRKE